MSDTTFRQGPWVWYWQTGADDNAECGVFVETRPGHAYAIARCPRYEKEEQWKANAALIAAAPDLYAALFEIAFQWAPYSDAELQEISERSGSSDTCQPMSRHWAQKMIAARAALAKARGGL